MDDSSNRRTQYCVLAGEVQPTVEFHLGPVKSKGELISKDDIDQRFNPSKVSAKDVEIAANGSVIAIIMDEFLRICDMDTGNEVARISRPGIQKVACSPLGSFVLTFERFNGGENENLKLWRVSDGKCVFSAHEKHLLNTTWPLIKWTSDESVAAHMTKNTIRVYENQDFSKYNVIRDEGVAQFSIMKNKKPVSEENPCKIATFKPESSSRPGKVSIFNYPGPSETPVCGKSFHKAQEVEFNWSPMGDAVLVKTSTDVDTTGQSYYGESHLYLLHADGSFDANIIPSKGGGFHDIAWSPMGKVFVAIAGKSPAASMLYNMKGAPILDFGEAHRNTIRWSPHGRFLCLGGFGNLSGDMDFWDINKKLKIGSTRSDCAVTQEWSPCGRFFMTATLFPRMRVDNGVTFYTYAGEFLYKVPIEKAAKAIWRPAPPGIYPDRPMTPKKNRGPEVAAPPPPAPEKKVYRPPGATGALAQMMRKEREIASAPKKIATTDAAVPQKSKSALRRERKKKVTSTASGV